MADLKTKPTDANVRAVLAAVDDEGRRADALRVLDIMREITGETPRMWGPTMVGFGAYHYVYASGHEGDSFLAGFSPRKSALVLYFNAGLEDRFAAELRKLGKAKASKGCLYIKKLADVDLGVLTEMIRANAAYLAGMARPRSEPAAPKKSAKKR